MSIFKFLKRRRSTDKNTVSKRPALIALLREEYHDKAQLMELQEALTYKLAGLDRHSERPAKFSLHLDGLTDDVQMYMIHLLSGQIPLTDNLSPRKSFSTRDKPPARKIDTVGTLSMDVALKGITSWKYDPFMVDLTTRHRPLSTTAFWILKNDACVDDLDLDEVKLASFLSRIESGYPENPYHNRLHAADVLQKIYMIISFGGFSDEPWSVEERFAVYFAAIIHDFGHPGFTNWFLVRTRHPLAVSHNDISVLENHHLSEAFKLLQRPENDFVHKMPAQKYVVWRRCVIDLVLATDMTKHFDVLAEWGKTFRPKGILPVSDGENSRLNTLKIALKSADIGHCCVSPKLHKRWTGQLQEEYFLQGDQEATLGLSISPLMNRNKPGLLSSQTEFFDLIAIPLFSNLCAAFPETVNFLQASRTNRAEWAEESPHPNKAKGTHRGPGATWMMPSERFERTINDMYAAVMQDEHLQPHLATGDMSCLSRKQTVFLSCVIERSMPIDLDVMKDIYDNLQTSPGVREYDITTRHLADAMSANGYSRSEIDSAVSKLNPLRSVIKLSKRISLSGENRATSLGIGGLQLT